MLASERIEPTVIPFIMAEAETETAVAEPAAEPTLESAYNAEHSGIDTKPPKKPSGRNTTLADEEDTARGIAETEHKVPRRREQTLQEAHDSVIPEEAADPFGDSSEIPEALQDFDADQIADAMLLLGITEADLEDQRWINALKMTLESQATEDAAEEGAESDNPDEKPAEEKPEEKPAEVKPELKSKLADLTPEEQAAMKTHIEQVWQRAKQVNSPIYQEHFCNSLAKALDCPPEEMGRLNDVVEVLQFGAQNLLQTSIHPLVTEYMQQNFAPQFGAILESYVPGLAESFREATISNVWGETLESEAFKDLGLPKFGTPEFQEAAEKVHAENPWLLNLDPTGPDGKPLPIMEALRVKAIATARLLAGQRVTPKQIAQQVANGIAMGKKTAERSTRRVSASRILRGGRTTGSIETRDGSERESLMDAFKRGSGGGAI